MAGSDRMKDARGLIQNYIEQKVRELLEDPINEYQDPNWVQAALLFEHAVAPCERYTMEHLYKLAQDIIDKAEQHGNRWVSQVIPGMYNEKVIDPVSIDMNNLPDDVEVWEYKDTINTIKKWMKNFQEERIDIKIS